MERNPLNALTKTINKFMTPTIPASNKRKREVKRPYGESLTSEEALDRLQQEADKKKKNSNKQSSSDSVVPKKRFVITMFPTFFCNSIISEAGRRKTRMNL